MHKKIKQKSLYVIKLDENSWFVLSPIPISFSSIGSDIFSTATDSAAIVSGIIGVKEGEGFTDSIIILVVVIVNAIIGVAQENKAEKSLEALQKLSLPNSSCLFLTSSSVKPFSISVESSFAVSFTDKLNLYQEIL